MVLLGIFMYVYTLLGMQLFAGKLKFMVEGKEGEYEVPRAHFDTLSQALLTVTQVIIGEKWD